MGSIVRLGADLLEGGEINTAPPHRLGVVEAASAVNLDPRSYRGAQTRTGRATYSSSIGSNLGTKGLKAWSRQTGSNFSGATVAATDYVIYRTGTTFYHASSGGTASCHIGGTSNARMNAVPLDNILVVVCDGLTPAKWDGGTTMSALGGSPPTEAKYACVYASKVWLAGNDDNPQTIYFSATNNAEQYSSVSAPYDAGSITSQEGGGDVIRGLRACRKWMCVFYRYYTEILTGETVFNVSIDRLSDKGLVSEAGHCGVGDVCFFASDDGVYMVAGARASDITTSKVKAWYNSISDKSKITLLLKDNLLLVIDQTSGVCYACDYNTLRWSAWSDQYWESGDTSNSKVLYAGPTNASTQQLQILDTGTTDNASSISAYWRTGNFPFGWPDCKKNHRDTIVHALPGMPTVTVTHYGDGTAEASTEALTFASTGDNAWARVGVRASLRGQFLGAKFAWSGQGTLYGFAMYAEVTADNGEVPNEV